MFMSDVESVLHSTGGDADLLKDAMVDLHIKHIHPCVHDVELKNGMYMSPPYEYKTKTSIDEVV